MANKKLSAVITIGGAVSGSLKSAFGAVTKSTSQLGDAVGKLENRQKLLGSAIQRMGRAGMDVDKLRTKYAAVTREIDRQRAALERIQRLEAKRSEYSARAGQAGAKFRESMVPLAVTAVPVIGAVKKSAEFNWQLQAIGNTANMTREQIDSLGRVIIDTSREVGKSAEETQGAMGYLVAAGLDVPVAEAMLLSIGKTATGTASEIEDVAKAAFTLNDTLKITPGGMSDALGKLVQAGKEGNFEFKDMAAELPILGAGFVALKMQGTEAVATMGAALQIARKGAGSSSQAANNMSDFLGKVMAPDVLKKAQKNFGVDLYKIISQAQKKGQNPFEAAIAAIDKMTKGGDQKLLGELFADKQVQNFLRPMLQNLKEYERIKGEVLKAGAKTMEDDFAKMADTAKEKMAKSGGEVGRLATAFGTSLEPAIGSAMAEFNAFLVPVTKWVQDNPKTVAAITGIVGGMMALRTGFFLAQGMAYLFAGKAAAAALGFGSIAKAITAIGGAIRFAGGLAMANPAIMALTLGGTAAYLAYQNRDKIAQTAKDMFVADPNTPELTPEQLEEYSKPAFAYPKAGGRRNATYVNRDGAAPQIGGALDAGVTPPEGAVAARGARSSTTVTDQSSHVYNITQQPGQDTKALAEEIERRRRAELQARSRSSMVEGAGDQ